MVKIVKTGKCGENLTWSLDNEGTLTISGCGEMYDYNYLADIPWSCEELENRIKKVIVEEGITHIGNSAFIFLSRLVEVILPDSLKSIGGKAFYGCESLRKINLPNKLTKIMSNAFGGCSSLAAITIPDKIVMIKDYTFKKCIGLTEIILPESVKSIGFEAFYNCTSLKKIVVKSPYCCVFEDSHTFPLAAVIYGYKNSETERYANRYNREFISLD